MHVVYEDDSLGVVWKPRSMKTAREHAQQKTSAEEESANLLRTSSELDALPVALACYTLDKAVEGLLVMAKTTAAKSRCESDDVLLRFQALVCGQVLESTCEVSSVRVWHPRDLPNDSHESRRQHRAKGLCIHFNKTECYVAPIGSDPLRCPWHRLHACAGCGGPHSFLSCPESAHADVQAAAAEALARAHDVVCAELPELRPSADAIRPCTSMRVTSTARCMGGDTFNSSVELRPAHGFHGSSVLSEQLSSSGHPVHPQDKLLKGSYRGVFLACTGITVPAVDGCSAPPLVIDVPAPDRFARLLKKEEGLFEADRRRSEAEYEACGYSPSALGGNSDDVMPVQYRTGLALFCGRRYLVTRDVLIPRPCYEPIVEGALQHLRSQCDASAILDLGCGSGCLLLACLAELPHALGVGLDLCPKAIQVARSNAERFETLERCEWKEADFNSLPDAFEGLVDGFECILFNPPYLERSAWLSASCLAEPDMALFVDSKYDAYRAVEDGLRQCRRMGRPLLREGGVLAIGLGSGHCATVRGIYESYGEFQCESVLRDPAGIERCIVFRAL